MKLYNVKVSGSNFRAVVYAEDLEPSQISFLQVTVPEVYGTLAVEGEFSVEWDGSEHYEVVVEGLWVLAPHGAQAVITNQQLDFDALGSEIAELAHVEIVQDYHEMMIEMAESWLGDS